MLQTKKGNIILPLISAAALIVLLTTGYLLYQSRLSNQKGPRTGLGINGSPNQVLQKQFPKSQNFDEYAGWKTYSSEKNKFSLKYPPDWKFLDVPNETYQFGDPGVWFVSAAFPPPQTDAIPDLSINISAADPTVNWNPNDFREYKKEEYQIGNLTGKKITGLNIQSDLHDFAIIAKAGKSYVSVRSNQSDLALSAIDKILRSFKYSGSTEIKSDFKTFTSKQLGISFNYETKTQDNDYPIEVVESGNRVYIHVIANFSKNYTDGQWIEVFPKDKSESLEQVVDTKFLNAFSKNDCLMKPGSIPQFELLRIEVPREDGDSMETLSSKWNKCPKTYTSTNGLSYFLMDPKHPDKFAYFSIGQYMIGSGNGNLPWQDTIKFL